MVRMGSVQMVTMGQILFKYQVPIGPAFLYLKVNIIIEIKES